MVRRGISLGFLFCLIQLTGCQLLPPAEAPGQHALTESRNQMLLASLPEWQVTGKMGVSIGKRRYTAAINQWRQQGRDFDIHLSSTLMGLGAVQLIGSPEYIELVKAGEPRRYSTDPDGLVASEIELPLPLSHVPYWILGRPAPGEHHEWANQRTGNPTLLQSDWQIEYSRVVELDLRGASVTVPTRVDLKRKNVSIRLIINEWIL